MMGGHASHQVGLDADIWLSPMPPRELSRAEREEISATMVVADSRRDVDPKLWTPGHFNVIKAAASDPEVERIFVNPAIKVALCRGAGSDRAWLEKVRPWWGHDYHFHVRIRCPADSHDCKPQPPATGGDGCGAELNSWFTEAFLNPPPSVLDIPRPGKPMSSLPPACRTVAKGGRRRRDGRRPGQGGALTSQLPRVAIAVGDPAGIGPEISLKAAVAGHRHLSSAGRRRSRGARASRAGGRHHRPVRCASPAWRQADWSGGTVQVLAAPLPNGASVVFGTVDAVCGRAALASCRRAIAAALAGEVDAVVAAPHNQTAIAAPPE